MISVCIATYNGETYIKDQLVSILSQLGINDEIIISDDYSTDNTIKEIKKIDDDRIKIVFNESDSGYTNNFENSLKSASGDFIFLSDQDDVWYKTKVEKTIQELQTSDFVVSDAKFVDVNLNDLGTSFFKIRGGGKTGFYSNLLGQTHLGCCLAFNRAVLNKALPFPKITQFTTHDLWLSLVGTYFFKTTIINEPLVYYRRHSSNVSNGGTVSTTSLLFKIKFRAYNLYKIWTR